MNLALVWAQHKEFISWRGIGQRLNKAKEKGWETRDVRWGKFQCQGQSESPHQWIVLKEGRAKWQQMKDEW